MIDSKKKLQEDVFSHNIFGYCNGFKIKWFKKLR